MSLQKNVKYKLKAIANHSGLILNLGTFPNLNTKFFIRRKLNTLELILEHKKMKTDGRVLTGSGATEGNRTELVVRPENDAPVY